MLAGLLTLVASAPFNPIVSAAAATPSPPTPPSQSSQLIPARLVNLQSLPASTTITHPNASRPFLMKDPASHAAAQQLANQGKTGRRSGVVSVQQGRAQVATGSATQSPQRLAGFPVMDLQRQVSLYGADQNNQPPDTQLAAGPTNLAEADNSALSIWTKTGSLVSSYDLNALFTVPPGYSLGDPRILYDAESGRWMLSGFAFNFANDSKVYLAASVTTDPAGSWNAYVIASAVGVLFDQPMTGVNSDKVVVSWNDFSGSGPTFSGQETRVLQKSDLVSGLAVRSFGFGPDQFRQRLVPAQSLTSSTTEWLAYNTFQPTVGVVAITGTPAGGDVVWAEYHPAIQATTIPPGPRQPSGVPVTQDIDDRFLSAVSQDGLLWVSGTDGCTPAGDSTTRSCMKLVAISTAGATPAVAQDIDVGQTGVDLYYPAVTLSSSGDLFVAYSASSSTLFPSAVAIDSLAASPTTFESPITLASGLNSYRLGTSNRWGDYSAAAPDPSNPADIWLTAEYQASATIAGNWGTATGRLAIQPTITSVNPNSGLVGGGLQVTIAGSHFEPGATVTFGANAATTVTVVNSAQITATTPAAAGPGAVNVVVTNPDATAVTAPSAFTYKLPPTTVTSVVPHGGPLVGGTSVVITGTNFSSVTAVSFGSTAATAYTVNSATQITATSPAGTGTADVTVTAVGGTSATSAADRFTYGLGAPTGVAATAGNESATVTWTAPGFDGGSAIMSYTVTGSPGGSQTLSCPCTTLQAIVGSLTNGTSYTFTVHAINGSGSGPESASSNAVTPAAPPGAPTNVIATAGDSQATVSWTAPSANGGSPVTSYRVTPYIGTAAQTPISAALVTSFTVTGLANGTAYTFAVTALNAAGAGAESLPSNSVTPVHPAGGPVVGKPIVGDFNGDGKADLALVTTSGVSVALSTGSAFSAATVWAPFPFYGSVATLAGDVTGDGKADLLAVNANQVFVLPSTGTGFGAPSGWSNIPFYGTRGTFLADVNGDGKADLVAVNNDSVWVMLSTGSGFGQPIPWSSALFYGNLSTQVGDVTGDGKADLIAINSTSTWVMTSTGSGFSAPTLWSSVPFYGNLQTIVLDANGDGKVDLVALNSTSTWIMTSTGSTFGPPTQWSGTPFYGTSATLSGDVNGDHKVDLVAVNAASVWVARSTGAALSAPELWW
jgi:hypothetical protein